MSGFAALVRGGRSVDRGTVERMVDAMAHRGPDGRGIACGDDVGLGHLLMETTPEDGRADLPREDGPVALTCDARIDNRGELLEALSLRAGNGEGPATDAEIVAAAYRRWGTDCPERLVGAFAFVLHDRERGRVVCARDHAGIRPFYYHAGETFAAASEIKGLLCLDAVSRELDELRIGEYLASILDDAERTFYRGIRRLPPGHVMTVDADDPGAAPQLRRYWHLDPGREVRLGSDEAYAAAFREVFTEAVRCRLRSSGRVGAMLSGGLDSSSIACVARDLLADGTELPTFSAVFEAVPEADEREYVEAVLDRGGFDPHFVRPDRVGPLLDVEEALALHDEPFFVPNHFVHWLLHREAADAGVRVLLDGTDGDTAVSHGRGYLAELARRGRWVRLYRELSGYARNFDHSRRYVLAKLVAGPLVPAPVRRAYRRARGRDGYAREANPTLDPDFVERVGLEERAREVAPEQPGRARSERERHYRKLVHGANPLALEVNDRIGARFGVEPRYPFFDRRVVEFCLALPPDQKIRRGWTRYVLRRAMDGVLPADVRRRGDKANLAGNFHRGLREFDGDRLEALVRVDRSRLGEYLDAEKLAAAHSRFRDGGDGEGMTVWTAATLALWVRGYMERATPVDPPT